MKLLFIHDHRFFQEGETVYTGGEFPYVIWENNYLKYFDSLTIIGRQSGNVKDKWSASAVNDSRIVFRLINQFTSNLAFIINYRKIKHIIKNEISNVDITSIRLPSTLGYAAIPVLLKNHKPFVVEIVSDVYRSYWYMHSILGKICALYFETLTKKYISRAPYVFYVGEFLQKKYPNTKCSIVLSDVILNEVITKENLNLSRFAGETFKIGLVGSFVGYKGQDILLKAISELPGNIAGKIELFMIGTGNYDWVLKTARKLGIEYMIKQIGEIAHDDLLNLYKTLSLYVQPSFIEGMPRALLEAMSMGCPVLASRIGGMPEIIMNQYLHTPGDFKELSRQIGSFFLQRDLLQNEAYRSLDLITPFLGGNIAKKRDVFYKNIFETL